MRWLQRGVFWGQIVAPFALMAWAIGGIVLFSPIGDGVWIALGLLIASPALVIAMLVPAIIAWSRRATRTARATSVPHVVATLVLWAAGIAFPFFVQAVSDVSASSKAEQLGMSSGAADTLGIVVTLVEIVAWALAVVFAGRAPFRGGAGAATSTSEPTAAAGPGA